MKCDKHNDKEAIAACVSCGNGVCEDCRLQLAGKNYCQECADQIVTGKNTIQNPSQGYVNPGVETYDGLDAGEFIFVCIFSPIAGAIAYLVWHDKKPKKAQQSCIIAIVLFIILLFLYVMFLLSSSFYY